MSKINHKQRLIFYSNESGLWTGTLRCPGHLLNNRKVSTITHYFYWVMDENGYFIQYGKCDLTLSEVIEKIEIEFQERLDDTVMWEEID